MTAAPRICVLASVFALAACADEPEVCPSPLVSIRDPARLVCTPHKLPTAECPLITLPPWSRCNDGCEQIHTAAGCAALDGCRIAWMDCLSFPDQCADRPDGFAGCYGVTTIEPVAGACDELADAVACASRDDCAGFYVMGPTCPGGEPFFEPNGEACHFTYVSCHDELSPPA